MKKVQINDWGQEETSFTTSNEDGKLKMVDQPTFSTHRSGWNFAIDSISHLHNDNAETSFFGFLENEFGRE